MALIADLMAELEKSSQLFLRASEGLLNSRKLLRRVDTKFLVAESDLPDILTFLSPYYAVLKAGDVCCAKYRTLYFDSPNLRFFHDHRRGTRARHKVRIRHYCDRKVSYLEVKSKRKISLTEKERIPISFDHDKLEAKDRQFVKSVVGDCASELVPQAWTNFRRITLVGLETYERVTLDFDLQLCAGQRSENFRGMGIIEVKQSPFCVRTPIMRTLREAYRRPCSASKYVAAIAMVRGGVRTNRFLPTLRRIERLRA